MNRAVCIQPMKALLSLKRDLPHSKREIPQTSSPDANRSNSDIGARTI